MGVELDEVVEATEDEAIVAAVDGPSLLLLSTAGRGRCLESILRDRRGRPGGREVRSKRQLARSLSDLACRAQLTEARSSSRLLLRARDWSKPVDEPFSSSDRSQASGPFASVQCPRP
jgi:hypothetical protein